MCTCSCDTPSRTEDPFAGWQRSLETLDLWQPFERLVAIRESSAACIRNIRQSERASVLGLGDDVARLYAHRAERDNIQTHRQIRAAGEGFRERMERSDWARLSAELRDLLAAPETRDLLAEHRERWTEAVFEADVSDADAGQMMEIWDEAATSLHQEGLDGLLGWTLERLDRWSDRFQAPDYGRGPNSPLTVARAACVAAVVAATLAALVACAYIPFCWCCLAPLIAWGASEGTKACARI